MSGSLNEVNLIGHLGADPEVRHTQDGRAIANLRVATAESWKDKQSGERKEKTEWHRVVIFSDGLAKIAEKYLKKGSKVYLSGALQTRKWTDKDGQDRYSTEIVLQGFDAKLIMLDKANGNGDSRERDEDRSQRSNFGSGNSQGSRAGKVGAGTPGDMDDEIPFAPEWR